MLLFTRCANSSLTSSVCPHPQADPKIKESGYPREISGEAVYNDICDQIEGKENGDYVLLSKFEEDVVFEYHITISDEEFNLGVLTMRTPEGVFETDFDK